ncbi:M14 family zinc carboxypeptidase [Arthrobacter pigmenti]
MSRIPRRSRATLGAIGAGAMLCTLVITPPVTAAPGNSGAPGHGTCKTSDSPQFNGWTTYEELGPKLERIEANSSGRVQVEVTGQTEQGRNLYTARVGTGDRVLLVQSAIHGNERTGTEALLAILKDLGSGNDPDTKQALEGVTLVAMPMVNPDGGELNRRTNVISWENVERRHPQLEGADRAWYHRLSNGGIDLPGFDLNRDFNADLDYVPQPGDLPGDPKDAGFYLSPESQAIRDVYVNLQQEFGEVDAVVDLHHMGPCDELTGGEQDGKHVSVALDYPPLGANDGSAYKDEWPELDQDKSRRYALAVANGLKERYGSQSPLAAVARYYHPEEREYAGQGRSAFALNGSATVLFEVRGQSDAFGQKMKGMLVRTVQTGVEALIESMATGEVDTLDGDDFFNYPDYGWEESGS